MTQSFWLSIAHHEREVVIEIEGELDVVTSPKLREALRIVLDDKPPRLRLDASKVTMLASAGIGVLVECARECRASGVEIDFRFSPAARHVLDMVGLWWLGVIDDGLAVDSALQDAMRAYARFRSEDPGAKPELGGLPDK